MQIQWSGIDLYAHGAVIAVEGLMLIFFSSHPHAPLLFVFTKSYKRTQKTYWQHFSELMLVYLEMQWA